MEEICFLFFNTSQNGVNLCRLDIKAVIRWVVDTLEFRLILALD